MIETELHYKGMLAQMELDPTEEQIDRAMEKWRASGSEDVGNLIQCIIDTVLIDKLLTIAGE